MTWNNIASKWSLNINELDSWIRTDAVQLYMYTAKIPVFRYSYMTVLYDHFGNCSTKKSLFMTKINMCIIIVVNDLKVVGNVVRLLRRQKATSLIV